MQLPEGGAEYITELSAQLYRGDMVNGVRYWNSYVTGPGVDDTYDPDVVFSPILHAGFWPGGVFGDRTYASTGTGPDAEVTQHDDRIFIRQLILGGSIGDAALKRYAGSLNKQPAVKAFQRQMGSLLVSNVLDVCAQRKAPFAYLVAGPVTKSEVIPIGSRVAALYYPGGISPKPALANLRAVVRTMELEETL